MRNQSHKKITRRYISPFYARDPGGTWLLKNYVTFIDSDISVLFQWVLKLHNQQTIHKHHISKANQLICESYPNITVRMELSNLIEGEDVLM